MKLRFLLLACALAFGPLAAQAQAGIYFNPIVSRVSNSTPDSGPFAFLGQNGTSGIFGGVEFGGYYDFIHQPKFDAGIDFHDAIQHGNSASLNSFVMGARIAAHPMAFGLKPYAMVSAGGGRTSSPLNPVHATKLEVVGTVGLDKRLNRHIDWRLVEIGYGSLTTVNSSLYGGSTPVPAARLLNFVTGFVLHVP